MIELDETLAGFPLAVSSDIENQLMRTQLGKVVSGLAEAIGYPVSLLRLLDNHPGMRMSLRASKHNIDARSVVQWHEFGGSSPLEWPRRESGTLIGWTMGTSNQYNKFSLHRPEYAQFGRIKTTENWICKCITHVDGFTDSKSTLRNFGSTDEMVEADSPELIDEITHKKLAENLAHEGIGIIHTPGDDSLYRYAWDERLFLSNGDGSHHLAAAKYIAARLPKTVPFCATLHECSLDARAIDLLRREFDVFVISDAPDISNGFYEAMRAIGATWLWLPMPPPLENTKAILLPRIERRSMYVATLLRKAGVADLGQHLSEMAATSRAWRAMTPLDR